MRTWLILTAIAVLGLLTTGCQTMARNDEQQARKYSRIAELNRRMLAEDIDSMLLLDSPSRLTHWHIYRQTELN